MVEIAKREGWEKLPGWLQELCEQVAACAVTTFETMSALGSEVLPMLQVRTTRDIKNPKLETGRPNDVVLGLEGVTDGTKAAISAFSQEVSLRLHADAVVLIAEGWSVHVDAENRAQVLEKVKTMPRPQEHPDREEVLHVFVDSPVGTVVIVWKIGRREDGFRWLEPGSLAVNTVDRNIGRVGSLLHPDLRVQ